MSFVSYAQNFEDVMLWRALKHVESGFYIDIGAQDPIIDSVSRAFYEHGWRGVHVEPTQQYSDKLRLARPDETVLQLAIGNQAGALTFYEFEDTGLSTADPDIARRHQEAGFCCNETLVPVISLDALFERIGVQDIHWLKLDVEGLEKAVLESWKSSSARPWVLVIESTRPLTQEESHDEWEKLLLAKGYRYVYFDGLNRFYISRHHADLVSAFRAPPNIFDGFVLSGSASQPFYKLAEAKANQAEAKANQAEAKANQAEAKANQAEAKANQAEAKANQAEANFVGLLNSKSWRLTAPLRWLGRMVRRITAKSLKGHLKALIRKVAGYAARHPPFRQAAINMLNHSPSLKARLKRVIYGGAMQMQPLRDVPIDVSELTPRARMIYGDLKAAIARRKRENR